MGEISKIQWTDATWNIAVGCSKVDEDCKYCYMYRGSLDGTRYNPKQVRKTKTVFNLPLKLKEPSKIFTSSLTDVFHEDCDSFRSEMWDIIRMCQHHTFQILTKRPERILQCLPSDWGNGWDNVWLGTSVGSRKGCKRIEFLRDIPAKVKFLSIEPLTENIYGPPFELHERLDFNHYDQFLNWVIIGGESGNDTGKYLYRPCELPWIEGIVEYCQWQEIPVFVKQLGTHLSKELGLKDRHGGDITEWPKHLQIRQFPHEI